MMITNSTKPKPLKVYGRSHYACNRCKVSKIKCSGEQPCTNCKNNNKGDECHYPRKDRKIVIMESDLNKLHDRVKYLEELNELNQNSDHNINQNNETHDNENNNDRSNKTTANGIHHEAKSIIQERQAQETKEFLFNHTGLQNFLISDNATESIKWKLLALINNELPPKDVAIKLIEKVFENYASEFYLIDFKSLLSNIDSIYILFESIKRYDQNYIDSLNKQIKRATLCYFFILIAYGEQISNFLSSNDEIPGIQFYLMASELFNLTHERISYEFIQSAVLLGLYSSNLNRYNTVYNYFGVAIRSAISQGFHRQQPVNESDKDAILHREKSKRLWWTIFIIDATWTAKMNMPSQLDYTETDVDLPLENPIDLYDNFDLNTLEFNVQLAKYISNSVQRIYGANKRTINRTYINTDQFNQKLLIKNVLLSFNELVKNFETPYLFQYKGMNIIELNGRKIANLFLRFNLLIAIITKPLILLVFNNTDCNIYEKPLEIEETINKAITTAIANINILLKLYEINRLFIIGFYDSQYLFTSILIIIMTSITDRNCLTIVNKAVALLKFMSSKGNINAQNSLKKLSQVNEYLSKISELDFQLDFNLDISDVIEVKNEFIYSDHYYNPYERCPFSTFSNFQIFKDMIHNKLTKNNGSDTYSNSNNSNINTSTNSNASTLNTPNFTQTNNITSHPVTPLNEQVSYNSYQEDDPLKVTDQLNNNRVNLSGSSQSTLVTMMNDLQNWEEYRNLSM